VSYVMPDLIGVNGDRAAEILRARGFRVAVVGSTPYPGVAAGIVLAWVVGQVLSSQLCGVSGYDPVTLCAVIAVLIAVGLAAAYVPSWRATRVDPAVCLRWE